MQEREKSSTDELPTRFAVKFFLSYESLKSRKRRIFVPTSYIQGHVCRSRWVRQGWSVAKKRGTWERKEKKRKRSRKVVCHHKKGMWERNKEKRPRKARRWLPQRQGSVCPQPRISFLGSRVFGFGSGPARLKYRLLRDLVYKEAMCKGSSGNGLL